MTKYKEYFIKMLNENREIFANFKQIHDRYSLEQDNLQSLFNAKGAKIIEIVREYENRLCANTERGMYNKYSANLAEKFQVEVRSHFPMIDHIGLKSSGINSRKSDFAIKKITLY